MNLLKILSTKPHNTHYLNRYIKFIQHCRNNPSDVEEYTENHHICPKADDLFPEYINLRIHKWNSIDLPPRQHIIAHIMLWKAFGISQSMAVSCMLGNFNANTNKLLSKRKFPKAIEIRYLAKSRKEAAILRGDYVRGKATYKDSSGVHYFLDVNDPKIQELNLVGCNSGMFVSEESRQLMRDAKYPNKTVEIYFLDCKRTVRLFSEEFSHFIDQGWRTEFTEDDKQYSLNLGRIKTGIKMTGRVRYATPDGNYYGTLYRTDPIIEKLKLISYVTDKNRAQWVKRSEAATEFRTGTNLYTNGIDEIFAHEPPDETWKLGRKPRSEDWETKRTESVSKKCKGSKTYTNGLINIPIQDGDEIPLGFYPGMKFRPNTVYSYTNEEKSVLVQFKGNHEIPQDLIRIKGTGLVKTLKNKLQ